MNLCFTRAHNDIAQLHLHAVANCCPRIGEGHQRLSRIQTADAACVDDRPQRYPDALSQRQWLAWVDLHLHQAIQGQQRGRPALQLRLRHLAGLQVEGLHHACCLRRNGRFR